jgi:tetratricopeptide (TPR) repeat protein
MSFKGSVESFSLADVFQNLSMNQQTGALHVVATPTEQKYVYFKDGQVRFLSRGAQKLLIPPPVFVARGLAQREQLEQALELQKQTKETIGSALIGLGFLTEEQLLEVARLQVEEEIYDLFSWEKATFEFTEGEPGADLFVDQTNLKPLGMPISHLIMEAARRVDEWERVRKQLPSFKDIYSMEAGARKAIEKGEMEVEQSEKRVASLLDASRDVEDLIEDSWLFKFEVLTALAGFMQSSLARPATVQELAGADLECQRQNVPKRRIKIMERMLALGGENKRLRKELAELLAKELLIEKACIHFNVLADGELAAGREEAAVEIYRRVLSISPKHVKAHEQLAAMYARKGLKREAFVHYRELFESLRDQNHNQEARVAGTCALDCDPGNTDLRNQLVELLVADNQKEAAAQHLELLGDQAAKAGNVKVAADSYRRAMQFRANDKQLKHKLADVMLSKEDRRARKRRALTALVVVIVLALIAGSGVLLEYLNANQFSAAKGKAAQLARDAAADEDAGRYSAAALKFRDAEAALAPALKLFSPFMKYPAEAEELAKGFNRRAVDVAARDVARTAEGERTSKTDLGVGTDAMRVLEPYDAVKAFQRVLDNAFSPEENKTVAKTQMGQAQRIIARLEDGLRRLRDPATDWGAVEEEIAWKKDFIEAFRANPKLVNPADIMLPVFIHVGTDDVNVILDGMFTAALKMNRPRADCIIRYSAVGPHEIAFKKEGYRTAILNVKELRTPEYHLKLEREYAVNINVGPDLGRQVVAGEPVLDGEYIYLGGSDGALLQVSLTAAPPVVRRYELPEGGLSREVVGTPFILRGTLKGDIVVYCTKIGDCIGLAPSEGGFKEAWPTRKGDAMMPLSAAPSVFKLPLLNDHQFCAMPAGNKLLLVDCENGNVKPPLDVKQSITAAPLALENGSIIAMGCSDGNIYGINIDGVTIRQWKTGARAAAIRSKPFMFDNMLIAGCDDGNLYLFNPKETFSFSKTILEGALVSQPLVLRRRLYVGSTLREGFFCVDMNNPQRDRLWKCSEKDIGGVTTSPVIGNKLIYFTTDAGRLYALDADRGATRWSYQVEASLKGIVGKPLLAGRRVYIVTGSGRILGFDEQPGD